MRNFKLALVFVLLLGTSASAQLTQTGAGKVAGGGSGCNGTIDLSQGCALNVALGLGP